MYQPPREPSVSARTLVTVLAVVFVIVIGAAVVVVLVAGGGSSKSPEGALNGYVAGVNSGDARAALDHTIVKLMPNYDSMVSSLGSMMLTGDPHIVINSVSTVDNSSMTMDQMQEAQDIMNEILVYINIEVQDMAFVEYNMTMEYMGMGGGPQTLSGEMLCVKVDGSWYLAMVTFLNEFSVNVNA
jgi:hypothetical protein